MIVLVGRVAPVMGSASAFIVGKRISIWTDSAEHRLYGSTAGAFTCRHTPTHVRISIYVYIRVALYSIYSRWWRPPFAFDLQSTSTMRCVCGGFEERLISIAITHVLLRVCEYVLPLFESKPIHLRILLLF